MAILSVTMCGSDPVEDKIWNRNSASDPVPTQDEMLAYMQRTAERERVGGNLARDRDRLFGYNGATYAVIKNARVGR